jgi:hypothetical protein
MASNSCAATVCSIAGRKTRYKSNARGRRRCTVVIYIVFTYSIYLFRARCRTCRQPSAIAVCVSTDDHLDEADEERTSPQYLCAFIRSELCFDMPLIHNTCR